MLDILIYVLSIYFGINLLLATLALCLGPLTLKEFLRMLWKGLPSLLYIALSTED